MITTQKISELKNTKSIYHKVSKFILNKLANNENKNLIEDRSKENISNIKLTFDEDKKDFYNYCKYELKNSKDKICKLLNNISSCSMKTPNISGFKTPLLTRRRNSKA